MLKRPESDSSSKKRNIIILAIAAVIVIAAAAGIYIMENRSSGTVTDSGMDTYNIEGVECTKKQNVETYLIMGTDRNDSDEDKLVRADTVILLAIDRKNETYALLPLDRDAMVSYEITDEDGEVMGEAVTQLALAYTAGRDDEEGCEITEKAVSKLMGGQFINGYAAINMDSIGKINNILGGVDVTIEDDFGDGSGFTAGQRVHLNDEQAEEFVRGRKGVGDGTNENRMKRQQAYLDGAISAFKDKSLDDSSFVDTAMNELKDCMVTDMTNAQFTKIGKILEGNSKTEVPDIKYTRTINEATGLAEVTYDETTLNYAIISLFYKPVEEWYFQSLLEEAGE